MYLTHKMRNVPLPREHDADESVIVDAHLIMRRKHDVLIFYYSEFPILCHNAKNELFTVDTVPHPTEHFILHI